MSTKPQIGVRVVSGPNKGDVFIVEDTSFIGTGSNCTICLSDPALSPIHARLQLKGSVLHIADLTADPDMKVNGVFAKARAIKVGDKITIAGTELEIIDAQTASSNQSAIVGRPDDIVIVAEEKSTITQIIRSTEKDDEADSEGAFYAEPVEEVSPEPESAPPSETEETLRKYRDKALYKPKEQAKAEKKGQLVALMVITLLIGAAVGVFVVHAKMQRNKLDSRFRAASIYAEANPDEVKTIVERYNAILVDAMGVHPQLAKHLDTEIKLIEGEVAREEDALSKLLKSLDEKSEKLLAAKKFDEAVDVYKSVAPDMAAKIKEERAGQIKKIQIDKKAHLARLEEAVEKNSAAHSKAIKERAKGLWGEALEEAASELLAGDEEAAIKRMREIQENLKISGVFDKASAVIAVAEELSKAKETSDDSKEIDTSGLSPISKTILAVIEGDIWKARSYLKKADSHVLKKPLLKRVQISDDDMYREKVAMVAFAKVWTKVINKDVEKIPKPEICIEELEKFADSAKSQDVKKVYDGLAKCKKDHEETMFVKRYADVFAATGKVTFGDDAGSNVKGMAGSYDGKIIQVSGDNVFVEVVAGPVDPESNMVGVFEERTLFVTLDGKASVASRVDVKAVVPFKVLSDKQVVFVKPAGMDYLKSGQPVLVRGGLAKGVTLISKLKDQGSGTIYQSDFEKDDGAWVSGRDGRALKITDGKLTYQPHSDAVSNGKYKAGSGDMVLKLNPVSGSLRMQFELKNALAMPLVISLGKLDFMLATGSEKSCIYIAGKLAAAGQLGVKDVNSTLKVIVERGDKGAIFSVNDNSIACRLDSSLVNSSIEAVRFFGLGQMVIDDLALERAGASAMISDVAGISTGGGEAIFRISTSGSEEVKEGLRVYLSLPPKEKGKDPVAVQGKASGIYGNLATCLVPKGTVLTAGTTVSFSNEQVDTGKQPRERFDFVNPGLLKTSSRSMNDVLLGTYESLEGAGKVNLRIDGMVQSLGYVSTISDVLIHPETKEPLAAEVSGSVRSAFKQNMNVVACRFAETSAVSEGRSKGVLLSSRALGPGRAIDIAASRIVSPAVPLSTKVQKQSFWQSVSGDWDLQKGRIIGVTGEKAKGAPVVKLSESYSGNAQFDFDLRLGASDSVPKEEWVRSFMVELYFPTRQSGVTFGMDTGRKGLLVTGRTLSLVSNYGKLSRHGALPAETIVKNSIGPEGESLKLTSGTDYKVRVRRVGNAVELLVNGKRVAYVQNGDIRGEAHLLIGTAYGVMNLGRTSAMSLPVKCEIKPEEPSLGEFGYVVSAQDKDVIVDSDMHGLEVNEKVTIMKMGNIVKGDESTTIILERVAQGIVSDIGTRTARVLITDQESPVQRGMKVFSGERPESLLLTDKDLQGLERGF